ELNRVHAIIDVERLRAGLSTGELVDGLREANPEHDLQINYLPADDSVGYVSELLTEIVDRQRSRQGLILFGCPRRVQEIAAASSVPTVIFGSRYPTAASAPCVSVDNVAKGRVAADYLLNRGHQRIGLLMRETWIPGDRRVFEGVNQRLAEAELTQGALTLRSVPPDEDSIFAELAEWLSSSDAPTGIICQHRFADSLANCVQRLNYRIPNDLEVVIETTDYRAKFTSAVPHTLAQVPFVERVQTAGRLLTRLIQGEQVNDAYILPIQLIEPSLKDSNR
ncbi:MAG: substrate-binding domain-containing protein, partial [Planctomycetales bacterium]